MGFPSPGSRVRAPFAAPFINYIYEEHTFSVHLNRPKLITANGDWQTFRFKCPVWRKSNKRKRPVTAGTDTNPETLREKPAKPIPNSFRQLYPQGMEIVYRTSENLFSDSSKIIQDNRYGKNSMRRCTHLRRWRAGNERCNTFGDTKCNQQRPEGKGYLSWIWRIDEWRSKDLYHRRRF